MTTDPLLPQYQSAQALEDAMGSTAEGPFSFADALRLDRADAYPEEAMDALTGWGVHQHYVPEALGGKLTTFEEPALMWRMVSRRNLTLTIAHAITYVGANPVWV